MVLALLAGFLLLVLLYLLIWQPVQHRTQSAWVALEEQRDLFDYLQSRRSEVREPYTGLDSAYLQGIITATAAEQGLIIERLDSDGVGQVQIILQPLPFIQLLSWLQILESKGIHVTSANLSRRDEGHVAPRLNLRISE